MAASAVSPRTTLRVARAPRRSELWVIGLAGCAAAAVTFAISSRIDQPTAVPDAVIVAWIMLSYVACGLIAWSRRPESRFGPLMVAAGFGPLLSRLSDLDASVPHTIGEVCRLLPVMLFLHVFLAYPSGRLEGRFERSLVAVGYPTVVGLSLVAMMLGPSGRGSVI
jgi:hypothetical protein